MTMIMMVALFSLKSRTEKSRIAIVSLSRHVSSSYRFRSILCFLSGRELEFQTSSSQLLMLERFHKWLFFDPTNVVLLSYQSSCPSHVMSNLLLCQTSLDVPFPEEIEPFCKMLSFSRLLRVYFSSRRTIVVLESKKISGILITGN
jgi:hypothetical protein